MKMRSIRAIFRRGGHQQSHHQKGGAEGQQQQQQNSQTPEELSRASSVSSLNAEQKSKGAFAKLRKGASKEKIDKIGNGDGKRNDHKKGKNWKEKLKNKFFVWNLFFY